LPQKFNACQTLLAKFTSHVTWKVYNQTLPWMVSKLLGGGGVVVVVGY
jgi:hypothetical protein